MGSIKNKPCAEEERRILFGIIADEETTTGFLLAGIGESFGVFRSRSFFMAKHTFADEVKKFFISLYNRTDIGIIIVGSDLLKYISPLLSSHIKKPLPIILEIPSKSSLIAPLQLKAQAEDMN